jgi:molecular chaperone GrpE
MAETTDRKAGIDGSGNGRNGEDTGGNGKDAGTGAEGTDNVSAHGDGHVTEITEEIHNQVVRERDEYLDSLRRLQAEFENFRKRVLRESEEAARRASTGVVEELLPVLDNFERALQAAREHDEKVLGEGVELVYRQLRDVLDKRGLCEVAAEGEDFDPEHHEAVLCRPFPGEEEGKVMEVVEKGYKLDDRVVRPAKVVVSGAPREDAAGDEGGEAENG